MVTVATTLVAGYKDLRDYLRRNPDKPWYTERSLGSINTIVWHHSATVGQTISEMNEWHIEGNDWPGTPYHYVINWKGDVFYLVDIKYLTYGVKGQNTGKIHVVFVGNYQNIEPTKEMLAAAAELNYELLNNKDINITRAVTHMELAVNTTHTVCPGKNLVRELAKSGLIYDHRTRH